MKIFGQKWIKAVKGDLIIKTKNAALAGELYDIIDKYGMEHFRYNTNCCYGGESKPIYSIGFMIPDQKHIGAIKIMLHNSKEFQEGKDYIIEQK